MLAETILMLISYFPSNKGEFEISDNNNPITSDLEGLVLITPRVLTLTGSSSVCSRAPSMLFISPGSFLGDCLLSIAMGKVDPPALSSQTPEGWVMSGVAELRLVPSPNVGLKGFVPTTFQDWEDFFVDALFTRCVLSLLFGLLA